VEVPAAGKDGVEIRLRPGTGLSGTVYGLDGKPAAGALLSVVLSVDAPMVGKMRIPADSGGALSGAVGTYRIDGLPLGRRVEVTASLEAALSDPVEAGPLERGVAVEGVDLHLKPAGTVVARVVDEKGGSLQGASVSVSPASEEDGNRMVGWMSMRMSNDAGAARTDAAGSARVRPVRPGAVRVKASLQNYRSAEVPLVAAAGAETPALLTLKAGGDVAGRVVDEGNAPVGGATVSVQRFGMGDMVNEERTTAEDGAFRVGGLDGKGFMVRAEKTGFVPTSLNGVDPEGEAVVVTLKAAGAIVGTVTDEGKAAVAKFRVIAKKEGEAGANPMDWQRFMSAMAGEPYEDPKGAFRVEGLEPGTYALEVRAEGFAPGHVEGIVVQAGRDSAAAVVLPAGLALSGVVVRKSDGGAVAGARLRVPGEGMFAEFDMDFDLTPFQDLPGAEENVDQAQQMMGGFSRATAVSGADGRFTLRGLEAGSLRLMVQTKGLAPTTVRGVEVPAAQDLKVELSEEAAVEGVVTDAHGAPREGAVVILQRIPVFMRMAPTDAQGHYRIGGVGAGSYLFYVMESAGSMAGGFNMKSEAVSLEEGKTTRKDHRLGEGTKLSGTVTRGGKPAGGVMVMLVPASRGGAGGMGALMGGGGGGFAMGSTKEDGTYEVPGLSAGRYTVSVQGIGGTAPSGGDPLEIPAGTAEVHHDIALPENGIRGVVVDGEGKPVPGAAVTAVPAGRDITRVSDIGSAMESIGGQAYTDDGGRFAISDMKAGTFRVQVQAEGFGVEVQDGVSSESGADLRITIQRGTEVVVRVLGADGGPVRGAALFLADAEGRELTNLRGFDAMRTGEDGRATVRAPAGTLRFEATARGYAPGEVKAQVPASGEVVLRLARGAGVKATVKGADGAPLAGATVEIQDPEGAPYSRRFSMDDIGEMFGGGATGPEGSWSRQDLPAGAWKVRAVLPDGRAGEEKVTLVEGETAEVAITVR
jgi:protocatechuate 3,4-dioxygenase beta subunit